MFYSKYRPQTVAQLDNARIRETLGKTILENNWAHAYLFVGPRGTGKTSAARILAKIVNCPKRKKGEEPCNKCDVCASIAIGANLDVIEIDAASNTGVDDIRDLRDKVRLAPTACPFKVYIIDEVHMLSNSAFNALLKTLEEPPPHAIFVLATTEPERLPETVRSRCLVYDFGQVSEFEIVGSLERAVDGEKITVEEGVLPRLAVLASGSFRDAHKLLEQLASQSAKLSLDHLEALKSSKIDDVSGKLLKLMAQKKSTESLELIEDFAKDNDDKFGDLINSMLMQLRDILLLRSEIKSQVEDLKISVMDINRLVLKLIEALGLARDCPVPQLPLELVVVEFCSQPQLSVLGSQLSDQGLPVASSSVSDEQKTDIPDFWPKVLEAVKPHNHSLVALLRASRPGKLVEGTLTVEVFYKFHKARLEEGKNRDVLEKVVSGILGKETKIKFTLGEKAGEK